MVSQSDAINSVLMMKELSEIQQTWLKSYLNNPEAATQEQLHSHLNVVINLLGAQVAINHMLMNERVMIDNKLDQIIKELQMKPEGSSDGNDQESDTGAEEPRS